MPKQRQENKTNGADKDNQAGITRAADFRSLYVNFARLGFNPFELSFFFGEAGTTPERLDQVSVEIKTKIVMSPIEAKLLAQMLTLTLSNYEKKYGVIEIPDEAKLASSTEGD
ncbi:MAG: DUF3467 domain-containing protein [Terriglobales bacterium]